MVVQRITQLFNVSIPRDLPVCTRARAAHQATAPAEIHRLFSDFTAAVLEAEAVRLKSRYKDGLRFSGGEIEITPGRPLGDWHIPAAAPT